MNKKLINIPDNVRIGALDFLVEVLDLGDFQSEHVGLTNFLDQKISIAKMGQQMMDVTFLHEIIHAILSNAGYPEENHDEKLIDAIANGFYCLIRDNAKLFG